MQGRLALAVESEGQAAPMDSLPAGLLDSLALAET